MKLLLIISLLLTSGCAFARTMDVKIVGKNVKSVYACGDVSIDYKAHTEFRLWK